MPALHKGRNVLELSSTEQNDFGYDQLLNEIRHELKIFRESSKDYIPKLWDALMRESLEKSDARDRIEKDCIEFWAINTIRIALPSEAKDEMKARGGRTRTNKPVDASESDAKTITVPATAETYKGDAGNNPEFLKEYIDSLPAPKHSDFAPIDPIEAELRDENVGLHAKISELQSMIKVLSAVPNAGKLADLEQQIACLKYENSQLAEGLEGRPLTSAKQQAAGRKLVRLSHEKFSAVFIAIQRAAMKKGTVLLTIDGNDVIDAHADEGEHLE